MWVRALPSEIPLPVRVVADPPLSAAYSESLSAIAQTLGYRLVTESLEEGAAEYLLSFRIFETTDLFAPQFSQCHVMGMPDPKRIGQFIRCGEELPTLRWWVELNGRFGDALVDQEGQPQQVDLAGRTEIRRKQTPYEGGPIDYAEAELAHACRLLVDTHLKRRNRQQAWRVKDVITRSNDLASRACFRGIFFNHPHGSYSKMYPIAFNLARALMMERYGVNDEDVTLMLLKYQNPKDPAIAPFVHRLAADQRYRVREAAQKVLKAVRPSAHCPRHWGLSKCVAKWEEMFPTSYQ